MKKYIIEFPQSFEANTVAEIVEATGWSRETVYRIMDGGSRFPVKIRTVDSELRRKKRAKAGSELNSAPIFKPVHNSTPTDKETVLPFGNAVVKSC